MTTATINDSLLRLSDVLKVIPMSKTEWYKGIKRGIYPAPIKVGRKLAFWRASSINALIDDLSKTQ